MEPLSVAKAAFAAVPTTAETTYLGGEERAPGGMDRGAGVALGSGAVLKEESLSKDLRGVFERA
jgi:hypothetical protein